jgi:hypothetical protein
VNNALLIAIVSAVLGGGGASAAVALFKAKKTTGAEVDSIIVGGAEKAVLTMKQALEASQHETNTVRADRDRLTAEVARKDDRIRDLEMRLDGVQALLDAARADIAALRAGH